jgi:hypothetical protein
MKEINTRTQMLRHTYSNAAPIASVPCNAAARLLRNLTGACLASVARSGAGASSLLSLAMLICSLLGLAVITGCSPSEEFKMEMAQSGDEHKKGEIVLLAHQPVGNITGFTIEGDKRYALIAPKDRAARLQFRVGMERKSVPALELSAADVRDDAALLATGDVIPLRHVIENVSKEGLATIRDTWRSHPLGFSLLGLAALLLLAILVRSIGFAKRLFLGCLVFLVCYSSLSTSAVSIKKIEVERDIASIEALVSKAESQVGLARQFAQAGLLRQLQVAGIQAYLACDRAADAQAANQGKIDRISSFSASAETKQLFRSRYAQLSRRRSSVEDQLGGLAEKTSQANESLLQQYLLQREAIRTRIHEGFTEDSWLVDRLSVLARFPARMVTERLVHLDNVDRCNLEGNVVRLPDGTVLSLTTNNPAGPGEAQTVNDLKSATEALRAELEQLKRNKTELATSAITNGIVPPQPAGAPVVVPIPEQGLIPAIRDNAEIVPLPVHQPGRDTVMAANVGGPEIVQPDTNGSSAPPFSNVLEVQKAPHGLVTSAAGQTDQVPTNAPGSAASATSRGKTSLEIPSNSGASTAVKTGSAKVAGRPSTLLAMAVGGLVLLIGVAVVAWISFKRGRPYVLTLSGEDGNPESFELVALDDALLLQTPPTRDHASNTGPAPKIIVGLRGPVVRPGTAGSLAVNDLPCSGSHLLRCGDRLAVQTHDGVTRLINFLGCEPACDGAAAGV